MPRKPAHEQFDTLKAIQERAFDLFGRFGYEGVSIGDIAKAAKLSKGALYWHFHSKEELYLQCLTHLHNIFNEYIFDVMRAEKDPARSILTVFVGLNRLLQDPRAQNGISGYWLIPSSSETSALIAAQRSFEAAAVAVLTHAFKKAAIAGQLDVGADAEQFARAVITIVEAVVLPLRHQSAEEARENLRMLARTLFLAYSRNENVIELTRLI